MPPVTCCRTDVICSTEKRFRFTARPPGPWAGLCREPRPQRGPKNPEPLNPERDLAVGRVPDGAISWLGDARLNRETPVRGASSLRTSWRSHGSGPEWDSNGRGLASTKYA